MSTTVTLQPGKYVISDPCYVIPDDKWLDVVDDLCDNAKPKGAMLSTVAGEFFCVDIGGDGAFNVYDKSSNDVVKVIGMDAACWGILPVSICDINERVRAHDSLIHEFEIKTPIDVVSYYDSVVIGNLYRIRCVGVN